MSNDLSNSAPASTPSEQHYPTSSPYDEANEDTSTTASEGPPDVIQVIAPTPNQPDRDLTSVQTRSLVFVQVRRRLEELKGELLSVLDVLDARVRRILWESQQRGETANRRGTIPPWKREYKFKTIELDDLNIEEREDSCPICYTAFLELLREVNEVCLDDADKAKEVRLVGVTRLDCGHLFCLKDIATWTKSGEHMKESSCPACRSPIPHSVSSSTPGERSIEPLGLPSGNQSMESDAMIANIPPSLTIPIPSLSSPISTTNSAADSPHTPASITAFSPQPQTQPLSHSLSDSQTATSTALNNLHIPTHLPDNTAAELRAAIDEARARISELFADVEQRVASARAEVAERERERESLSMALDIARDGLRNARRLAISTITAPHSRDREEGRGDGVADRRLSDEAGSGRGDLDSDS